VVVHGEFGLILLQEYKGQKRIGPRPNDKIEI